MVDSIVKNIDSEYFLAFPYSEFADGFTMEQTTSHKKQKFKDSRLKSFR